MSINQSLSQYREIEIRTASPVELIGLMYDAALANLQQAQEFMAANDIAGRTGCLNRVSAILTELQANLNFEAGGNIASSLDRLYRYMKDRIFQANLRQESSLLKEVVKLLTSLREAWIEVARAEMKKALPRPAAAGTSVMAGPPPAPASGPKASPLANLNLRA